MDKEQKVLHGVIRNELNYSELVINSTISYEENYQLKMIKENRITGLLKVAVCDRDNCGEYIYDTSGMSNMKREFDKIVCDKEDIKKFLKQLMNLIISARDYMLDINCIVLDPQYIFCKDNEYYFCYYPPLQQSIISGFHDLTEYWVKVVDYEDYSSVVLICGLHKESMEEHYNLELLLEQYAESEHKQPTELKDAVVWNVTDEREMIQREDGLWKNQTQEEIGSSKVRTEEKISKMKNILKETSVGKYWEQKKKERWGEWDDLLSQEESSIMNNRR